MKHTLFSICIFAFTLLLSCSHGQKCLGVNSENGKYNTLKKARRGERFSYKTEAEHEARDRQLKRLRKSRHHKAKGTLGGKGIFGGSLHLHVGGKHASASANASARVKY